MFLSTVYKCVTIFTASVILLLCLTVVTIQSIPVEGKQCRQAFHCWQTEPINDDGIPLQLANSRGPLAVVAQSLIANQQPSIYSKSMTKRLDIGSGFGVAGRGAQCRCKDETCQYFSMTEHRFLGCDKF